MNKKQNKNKYKIIKRSIEILDLPDNATLKDVKDNYRELIKKWHPDKCNTKNIKTCNEKINEINKAYKAILEFIKNYNYYFNKDILKKCFNIDDWWENKFINDPIWGNNK